MPRIKAANGDTGPVSQWVDRMVRSGVFEGAEWAMDDPRALDVVVSPRFQWEKLKGQLPAGFEEVEGKP